MRPKVNVHGQMLLAALFLTLKLLGQFRSKYYLVVVCSVQVNRAYPAPSTAFGVAVF
jgi:hypothetical protein